MHAVVPHTSTTEASNDLTVLGFICAYGLEIWEADSGAD